ncbi:hypothetical protein HZH66_014342 [Vespula vulgaris]|uniref:Uncharacterized protein n=1 Tax=Vespula vulgaris TaxID=7454 RepID=A0A834J4H8_VESVU|nr:hypothetical protein HZH66_014342 [Vespula vulgaris]
MFPFPATNTNPVATCLYVCTFKSSLTSEKDAGGVGLLLLFSDSITVKFQFLVLDIVAIIQLFLNSYPAENLIEMSSAIGMAAYDLNWIDKSRKICKNLYILIQRSQKPVTVSIAGFIPELSLTYYMSSTAIGLAAYDLNWFDKSRKMCKNLYILIQRSQKPVTVSIPGFIPELSLTYYMSFLSSSFSYFTTLRAAVN